MRPGLLARCALVGLVACGPKASTELASLGPTAHFAIRDLRLPGGEPVSIEVRDGQLVAVGEVDADAVQVEGEGRYLVPAVIDSHVHLEYLPLHAEHAAAGVAAAVDLASPEAFLGSDLQPLRWLGSGPMITALGGYPTTTWGGPLYGIECGGPTDAAEAVRRLAGVGAALIKLPITDGAILGEEALRAAVQEAHSLGLPVASHALEDSSALLARQVGADLLAHTPIHSLSEETVSAWEGGAVISTLIAFGTRDEAVDNLRALHSAGLTVLYGSDLGNLRTAGIQAAELLAMREAGMSDAEILAAATELPAQYWGLEGLGRIDEGAEASFLLLDGDPHEDITWLASPVEVVLAGVVQP